MPKIGEKKEQRETLKSAKLEIQSLKLEIQEYLASLARSNVRSEVQRLRIYDLEHPELRESEHSSPEPEPAAERVLQSIKSEPSPLVKRKLHRSPFARSPATALRTSTSSVKRNKVTSPSQALFKCSTRKCVEKVYSRGNYCTYCYRRLEAEAEEEELGPDNDGFDSGGDDDLVSPNSKLFHLVPITPS
jgi:hypothetical protein